LADAAAARTWRRMKLLVSCASSRVRKPSPLASRMRSNSSRSDVMLLRVTDELSGSTVATVGCCGAVAAWLRRLAAGAPGLLLVVQVVVG
jgi:hypothetical protein